MKKFEAKTLEAAYALATKAFSCSLTELDCEIVQHPSDGFLGIFSKPAIIVVAPRQNIDAAKVSPTEKSKVSSPKVAAKPASTSKKEVPAPKDPAEVKTQEPQKSKPEMHKHAVAEETVLESFFDESETDARTQTNEPSETVASTANAVVSNIPLQEEIEGELKALIDFSCFDIDVVEADVIDNTAYVFIDGEDAALLIGKEGYRYNALTYLISNWLHNKHNLYLKLEIAQFLASQQEMIRSYMEPVIEHVEQEGWGRTRALDGILVQIALEQLREEFPNKYVAIKRTRNGDRYVLINEFNKR